MATPRPTRSTLRVAVVTGLVAFALGAAGTATAGPALTAGAVKKIATKVVSKAAPKLSVAHATSADSATTATTAGHATNADQASNASNADKLGGKDATALGTHAYQFTIQPKTPAGNQTFAFTGLPAGTYVVTYSVQDQLIPTDTSACQVITEVSNLSSTQTAFALGVDTGTAGFQSVAATGLLTAAASDHPALLCYHGGPVSTIDVQSGTVTLIPVDTLTSANTG